MQILIVAPHTSTGGLPQYLLKKVELLSNRFNVRVVEIEDLTGGKFVIQRKALLNLLRDNFISLNGDYNKLLELISQLNEGDVLHLEELPEYFLPLEISDKIYHQNRKYKIIETSHDSSFNILDKRWMPDSFAMVSPYQIKKFSQLGIPTHLVEYPIYPKASDLSERIEAKFRLNWDQNYIHILNVGLFTPRKNQAEIFEIARKLTHKNVIFHFVGNMADNFKFYWEPLINDIPSNCIIHGEKSNVHDFYLAADALFFASKGTSGDKETMPLVLKEALGYSHLNIFMYNLDVYENYFNVFERCVFLSNNINSNIELLKDTMNLRDEIFDVWYNKKEHKIYLSQCNNEYNGLKFKWKVIDSLNELTIWISESMTYNKGTTLWFRPGAQISDVNGFTIFVDLENGVSYKRTVFNEDKNLVPIIDNKKIKVFHSYNDSSSWYSFYEIFIKKDYLSPRKGDVVVDIGSNIGLFSLYALKSGADLVFSYEPIDTSFALSKKTITAAKIDKIIFHNLAVTACDSEYVMMYEDRNSSVSSIFRNNNISSESRVVRVKTTTLEKISNHIKSLYNKEIDYLKIDCEGSEYEIISNTSDKVLKQIRVITGEAHFFIDSHKKDFYEMIQRLQKLGFKCIYEKRENNVKFFTAINENR